ncbi:c-type cytochrome biogenesis protein CcmI [Methylobacterium durans]|uniref:c-type cytochrome biogenesis protein CcmI n=1 Tax=Methylobacterium durans TaxID=2202825 RepID=UPI002AFE3AD9|nr:c-type cytochrome biogenesis protein CcmI [Methylobacterium durans]MEA1834047.1 c-type cytochrome biogenesis protein CcmI [Methylobacterium durans]
MTAIWFILAFMTGAAVLALLWPMSRRADAVAEAGQAATETGFYEDQLAEIERDLGRGLIAPTEAEAARTEAARRLLRANRAGVATDAKGLAEPHLRQRRAASAFALSTIPLVALLAYGLYGSPNLPAQSAADRQAAQTSNDDLMKAIGQIEAKLAADPGDARGWAVLAPVYMRLGRFDDAARAYEAVARLKGETPQVLGDWGEALVAAGNGVVPPEAKAIFERAVALDAGSAKPRFYLARAAEQAGDTAGAIQHYTTLAEAGPADAPWQGMVRENLARLKAEPAAPGAPQEAGAAPDPNAAIRGMVDGLDQRLAKQGGTVEEWLRLVRSRSVLGERDKALSALERARSALGADGTALERLDAQAKELGLAPGKATDANPEPRTRANPLSGTVAKPAVADAESRADTEAAVAAVKAMPAAERDAAIRGMVAGLDRRLSAKGGTPDEWLRLVRSYSALGERKQASRTLDRARMALAADTGAVERLDALARELDLHGTSTKP